MQFVGTWQVVGLPDRELVFLPEGTGYFNVQGERVPCFRWWLTESGSLGWQFFIDSTLTSVASRSYEPEYEVLHHGTELVFAHAPFPFGIKHFRRLADA